VIEHRTLEGLDKSCKHQK